MLLASKKSYGAQPPGRNSDTVAVDRVDKQSRQCGGFFVG
jgi:hypothetical protein